MWRSKIGLTIATALALSFAYADSCFVFYDNCGQHSTCPSGAGWELLGECEKKFCENGVTCTKAAGGTAYQIIHRIRLKYKKEENGVTSHCLTSSYEQHNGMCCDCTGHEYPKLGTIDP
jgi:hypothetical protein